MGLGGAEFRLPLLITIFSFTAISAVILNKAMSLIVVGFSLVFRSSEISFALLFEHSDIIFSMLLGSVIGAWFGATVAVKLKSEILYKVIGFLLLFIASVLVYEHYFLSNNGALFENNTMVLLSGVIVGCGIGVVAAILGVAGGELYIPAIILIYGVDIKLAGSLSLAISLPTMVVAFFRYSQDESFKILFSNSFTAFLTVISGTFSFAIFSSCSCAHTAEQQSEMNITRKHIRTSPFERAEKRAFSLTNTLPLS